MKKVLGLLVLALFVFCPMVANATISINDGMKCTDVKKDDEGKYYYTCKFSATTTANEEISSISVDITWEDETNTTLTSVKGSGAFEAAQLGNTISFNAATPQTGATIEFGELTIYVADLSKECGFTYTASGINVDKPTQEVVVKPIENPKTGSAVSYVAIGAGILLVAGAFIVSRKNTKMYKI